MNKEKMKNIVLSRLGKGKTSMPKINITYVADRAVVSYKMNEESNNKHHIDAYYGFMFEYRLKCAVKSVHLALKRRLEKEAKKEEMCKVRGS